MPYRQGRGRSIDRSRPWYVQMRPTRLVLFMLLVCLLALPVAVHAVAELLLSPVLQRLHQPEDVIVLAATLTVAELLPIQISRAGRTDEVTISTTFALALAVSAPLGVVVLAQALPLVLDDLRRGKDALRPVFNVAQYTLTFAASRAAMQIVAGDVPATPASFSQHHLVAIFVAGLVFFVVNHGLVGTAVALATRAPIVRHLLDDIRFETVTSGLLLCLAPLVLAGLVLSPVLVLVVLLPIEAVRRSALVATQHEYDALHDSLTGLANRALLRTHLKTTLERTQQGRRGVALLMLDLDHFKEINDTLGHTVGDDLLVDVAQRLSASVRLDQAFISRLGGDEFAVVAELDGRRDPMEEANGLAERLSRVLNAPTILAGVRVDVQASIGIALAPLHGNDIDELLARADVALYAAKEARGNWSFYDPSRDEHTPERLGLLAELRDGMERGELVLHYQPKCEARSGQVVGMEALVRWQHPRRGLLTPEDFIPVAEQTGLIATLTLVVLEEAAAQLRRWLDAGLRLHVAVNLSVRHLTDLSLPGQVEQILQAHRVPPELMTLEVTESTIMNDPTRAVRVLALLRALGVRIAVDDYGTGYSSLAYLKRLAVDELKIDKSFIIGMLDGEDTAVIVRSTIELGHNPGLQVVAEGVENARTWQELLPLGCDVLQGYHISRPMPGEHTVDWVRSWQPPVLTPAPSNSYVQATPPPPTALPGAPSGQDNDDASGPDGTRGSRC